MFNPVSTQYLWTVVEIGPDYPFPDGEARMGVRVRGTNSAITTWMPRENLKKALVVQ